MSEHPPLLIVDDHEDDLLTLEELVRRANIPNPVQLFRSGDDVMQFLEQWCHRSHDCGRSALMLLDVRMPRVSGFDVLAWIRRHPLLHGLVVVMMSQIQEAGDAERAVQLGAHSYLLKYPTPLTLAALAKLAEHQNA